MATVEPGSYSKKQIQCKDQLIAWSHKRRFETGLRILKELHPKRLLDYGSGDGTFLAMALETSWRPRYALGAELETSVLDDCRTRFRSIPHVEFCLISELAAEQHRGRFDTVVCMEVLEHVVHIENVLSQIAYVLAPGGRVAISVPVEVGFPLVLKQVVRRIAGWRNLGYYQFTSVYTVSEMLKSIFPGPRQHIVRPLFNHPHGFTFYDHKGFNWRYSGARVRNRANRSVSGVHFGAVPGQPGVVCGAQAITAPVPRKKL